MGGWGQEMRDANSREGFLRRFSILLWAHSIGSFDAAAYTHPIQTDWSLLQKSPISVKRFLKRDPTIDRAHPSSPLHAAPLLFLVPPPLALYTHSSLSVPTSCWLIHVTVMLTHSCHCHVDSFMSLSCWLIHVTVMLTHSCVLQCCVTREWVMARIHQPCHACSWTSAHVWVVSCWLIHVFYNRVSCVNALYICIYIYICTYICMLVIYICMFVIYICICISNMYIGHIYSHMYMYTHICMYIHIYIYICIHTTYKRACVCARVQHVCVSVCVCVCVRVCVCMLAYIHICGHTHSQAHT